MKGYIVKEKDKRLYYSDSLILENPAELGLIAHPQRIEILKLLSKQDMYASELAKKLNMHEQKIYYHINKLLKANVLEVTERREIRGTTAKMYKPKSLNFSLLLEQQNKPLGNLVSKEMDKKLEGFLSPFVAKGEFDATIVVGNPDPHGEYKARARDGHYGIDLAMFLGQYSHFPRLFPVSLDVDITDLKQNLIIIGGPAANLVANTMNSHFLRLQEVGFSEKRPFGIKSLRLNKQYSDESIGLIGKVRNPFDPAKSVLLMAGISSLGTKAAVMGLTRHYSEILAKFNNEDNFHAIVQGFDLDGDGKIDSVEVIE